MNAVSAGKSSESIRLNPGEHEFELSYHSKPDGTATFRLYWEEAGFVRQTIPFSAFKAEASAATTQGALQRRGRFLFASQNCTKCHSPGTGFGASPMPETAQIGPILSGAGDRLSEEWLRKWIADPHKIQPTTHMPALVDPTSPDGLQQASDLGAYLTGLKVSPPGGSAVDPSLAQEGGVHFHELGCIACHHSPDQDVADPTRVSLNNVASKYLPGALVAFLKQPDAYHPFTQMPNFRLTDAEAERIAAFLTKASEGKQTQLGYEFAAGDALRGAKVAESLQCGACHPGMPVSPQIAPATMGEIFKNNWAASGCVAPAEKRGKSPRLNIDDTDRAALVAFAKTGTASLSRDTFLRVCDAADRSTPLHRLPRDGRSSPTASDLSLGIRTACRPFTQVQRTGRSDITPAHLHRRNALHHCHPSDDCRDRRGLTAAMDRHVHAVIQAPCHRAG